jgi:hypothetical protein
VLPTFLVIGAQRAGTTQLHGYLDAHPQVFVTAAKELNFFADGEYARGLGWYEEQFAAAGSAKARGEVSPFYTSYPWQRNVPERVAADLPGVRCVYLLRHPVERMLANYRHQLATGNEHRPPEQALLEDTWQYLDRSGYSMQIERWLEHVPRASLLLVRAEALRDHRTATVRCIVEFLGADPLLTPPTFPTAPERRQSERPERRLLGRLRRSPRTAAVPPPPPVVSDDLRRTLVDRLRPDLERLPGHVRSGPSCLGPDETPEEFRSWGLLDDPCAPDAENPRRPASGGLP